MEQLFTVLGMTCGHCEKAVTQAIRALDPEAQIDIDRAQQRVRVVSVQDRAALRAAMVEEGYTVSD